MTDILLTVIITQTTGLIAIALTGLINYKLKKAEKAINEVTKHINGRMENLLEVTKSLGAAEGKAEGIVQGKADEKADEKTRVENNK